MTNFIQRPLPPGSRTGAIKGLDWNTPGALGKGQQAAFGITTFNTFWIYVTPILGAFVADTYWGRYKTVCVAIGIAIIGHILMVGSCFETYHASECTKLTIPTFLLRLPPLQIVPAIPEVLTTNPNASYGLTIAAIIIVSGFSYIRVWISGILLIEEYYKSIDGRWYRSIQV